MDIVITNLGSIGTIEAYITAVNQIPMLSQDREIELANNLWNKQDLNAAQELILSHLRLVVSVARQYLGYGLAHADLIQEGNIGLMKAVKRFNPDRGVRLVSFAIHWIKAEIHEFIIRNWRIIKIASTKAQRKLFFNLRSMRPDDKTLNPKQVEQIAQELNVHHKEVSEMEIRLSGHDLSIHHQDDDEEKKSVDTYLSDDNKQEPTQILIDRDNDVLQSTGLSQALACLDYRSRRIIEARWLNNETCVTLCELALEFQVSAERIRQIESAAMKKMRTILAA